MCLKIWVWVFGENPIWKILQIAEGFFWSHPIGKKLWNCEMNLVEKPIRKFFFSQIVEWALWKNLQLFWNEYCIKNPIEKKKNLSNCGTSLMEKSPTCKMSIVEEPNRGKKSLDSVISLMEKSSTSEMSIAQELNRKTKSLNSITSLGKKRCTREKTWVLLISF